MSAPKPVVLCILDGWGLSATEAGNAAAQARTPTFDRIMARGPAAQLVTHGPDVGLPRGQMGNSEVGHTNIGAGRVVAMDLGMIDLAIEDGSLATAPALTDFIARLRDSGGTAHLMALVSDGGVHGHLRHLVAAAEVICAAGIPVVIHAITDGRDVAPESAQLHLAELQASLPQQARIVTVIGRYWAMDRDRRWDRVARAFDALVRGQAEARAPDAGAAIEAARGRGETDEFVAPTVLDGYAGAADGDGIFCLNFRADRAREILAALGAPDFEDFDVAVRPRWAAMLGMVEYSEAHNAFMAAVFPRRDIVNTLGAWVAAQGLRQFRLAETEKYPHVTFFLNGGREDPEPGEDRAMPQSPNVATYDLQPEMAAPEVGAKLAEAIGQGYDLIVVNFANPDMVGHTGDMDAAIRAVEAVDAELDRACRALDAVGGVMLVTADHGNCETMIDPETGGPHTAHTTNPVPVALVGGAADLGLASGRLADIAPTILELMELPKPDEMTGESLIRR